METGRVIEFRSATLLYGEMVTRALFSCRGTLCILWAPVGPRLHGPHGPHDRPLRSDRKNVTLRYCDLEWSNEGESKVNTLLLHMVCTRPYKVHSIHQLIPRSA